MVRSHRGLISPLRRMGLLPSRRGIKFPSMAEYGCYLSSCCGLSSPLRRGGTKCRGGLMPAPKNGKNYNNSSRRSYECPPPRVPRDGGNCHPKSWQRVARVTKTGHLPRFTQPFSRRAVFPQAAFYRRQRLYLLRFRPNLLSRALRT